MLAPFESSFVAPALRSHPNGSRAPKASPNRIDRKELGTHSRAPSVGSTPSVYDNSDAVPAPLDWGEKRALVTSITEVRFDTEVCAEPGAPHQLAARQSQEIATSLGRTATASLSAPEPNERGEQKLVGKW